MSLSLDYSAMVTTTTTLLLSWLLLTSNIMAPMAFSQAGTMTSQHPAGNQKLMKKVVIKRADIGPFIERISNDLKAPKLSVMDTSYQHYHYPTQEFNNTNSTTTTNSEPKQIHHHSHSHYDIPVIPPAPKSSDVSRVFYNWFPDTTARVDSIITVSVPIPFCQFENSPCKPLPFRKTHLHFD